MNRPTKRHLKHVRRAVARLAAAGFEAVVTITRRAYRLEWQVGDLVLRCSASLHASGNAFESLWATIRSLFRARRLPVPA